MIVLDASAAVAVLVPSQGTLASTTFASEGGEPWIAPAIFAYEVRHALLRVERRTKLDPSMVDAQIIDLMADLEFVESELDETGLATALTLARMSGVSFYDACYLELALREHAALASRDGKLIEFAVEKGVLVFDLR